MYRITSATCKQSNCLVNSPILKTSCTETEASSEVLAAQMVSAAADPDTVEIPSPSDCQTTCRERSDNEYRSSVHVVAITTQKTSTAERPTTAMGTVLAPPTAVRKMASYTNCLEHTACVHNRPPAGRMLRPPPRSWAWRSALSFDKKAS